MSENVYSFTKHPQVRSAMERMLRETLEELERGDVAGLTIVVSRPEPAGGCCIRKAWEDRIKHAGALALAIADVTNLGD